MKVPRLKYFGGSLDQITESCSFTSGLAPAKLYGKRISSALYKSDNLSDRHNPAVGLRKRSFGPSLYVGMETLSSSGSLLLNTAMPPPPSPSASSSSVLGKRRRSGRPATSVLETEDTYHPGLGSFTESIKQQIENLNGGDSCWCCATEDNNICHVIARGSRRVIRP